ncbi:MAG: hypothetical protein WCC01_04635 [Acidimicrobiia bacterium]
MRRVPRFIGLVVAATMISSLVVSVGPPQPVEASNAQIAELVNLPMKKVRIVTGIAGLFGAFQARNRVYRDARIVQGERTTYYDALRDYARGQLHTSGGIRTYDALDQSKANAYLRLVETIENRRTTELYLVEDEKREARSAFHRTVRDTLVTTLLQSKGGRAVLGRVERSLSELGDRINDVRAALESGSPDAALDRLAAKVTDIPQLREQLKALGGAAAATLDQQLNGLISKANAIREGGVGTADAALATINAVGAELQFQANAARRVRSSSNEGGSPVTIRVPDGGGEAASADAIAGALTRLVLERNPAFDPERRPQMRQRVADLMEQETLQRSREIRDSLGQKLVTCKSESESTYLQVVGMLGRDTTIPEGEHQFFVCYLKPADDPIYAFIVEAVPEEEEEEEEGGAPWDEEETTTTTAPSTEAPIPIPPGTYRGEFNEAVVLPLTYADYVGAKVNEIQIIIDESGSVSGSFALVFEGDAFFGCPAYDRWGITIDEGQGLSERLPTQVVGTLHDETLRTRPCHGCGCYDERSVYDDTGPTRVTFTGHSEGTIVGWAIDEDFPFAAELVPPG